ncbi:MAG: DNA-directed RNA polymerase subunit alpha [Proteobacteria bacterium]|jgi:DNA-directed RNA polymerase subunit alpha|nr:DNA-directed RNA polymerase subunit alpha [Pseudomonadota bacterium]MBU4407463.1 DNA-directed RNA polymerase subunit alpha [Pseudomonadota bacterium]MDP2002212.1 DNA-directed RNA polymerase subunit alpha [Desulfurivibrionaceae bacterium]MDP2756340.1 DNA-directed RNA polymerase subunit alpha [Desulfurivibrionaceae bacterium]PKN23302.1 MAG: DNA-directed RNA polymerase subunit alpha [Deltaproteobacteria bacterium HGW-Deltaproteobacteria-3]
MTLASDPFYRNWHELIIPERLEVDQDSHTKSFGKFICQPLERGFATTIGNSLRRILLSSIQGAAITSVKIDGALHELSTIPGVKEDVTQIILNLKEVRLKLNTPGSQVVRIEKNKLGTVTAGDILSGGKVEIMNPDKEICTITGEGVFKAEFEVKWGKGYVPAEKNKPEEQVIGVIPIDAIFTPIVNVKSLVSQARVGQQTDYDKLTLEITTDGSVRPEDALAYAAKIMKEQLQVFIAFDEESVEPAIDDARVDNRSPVNENLYRSVEDLELSVRSANCLRNADIRYIGELVQKSEAEMLKTKNFGRKSLNEIKQLLSEMELSLGMKLEGWEPPVVSDKVSEEQS